MQPTVYLFFPGTCAEAMTRYAEIFGSPPPEFFRFSEMPEEAQAHMPGTPADSVMHVTLAIGEGRLMASDDPTGETPAMAGCNVNVSLPTVAEAERVFNALAEGGEVRMPMAPTFFAPAYGALSDRFGTRWMVMADSPAT